MISREVSIPLDGSRMPAYLARPEETSGAHPAVIVLQEVFGLTPETRRVTDLLASTGYVGLAIDYYHRIGAHSVEPYTEDGNRNAFATAARVTARDLAADVRAAVDWLQRQPFVRANEIATWGFDFGATAAFVSASHPKLAGAICFYPCNVVTPMPSGGEPPIDHAAEVAIPLLLVFGEKDYYVSRHHMDEIHMALVRANKEFRMQIYPNVGHSFFRHGRPEAIVEQQRYSDESIAEAVADAWDLVNVFLKDVFNRRSSRATATGDIHTTRTQSVR